jgi:hypothetical protein
MYIAGSVLVAVAVGVSIAMFSSGAGATTAATVSANTHAANHDDTTSVAGSATIPSDGGPVWAYDNLKVQITATPANATNGSYGVDLTVTGSFAGFANPRNAGEMAAAGLTTPAPGDALTSSGSVKGTYHLTVNSPTLPKASNLHAQQDPTTGLGDMVRQLFGDVATDNGDGTFSHTVVVSGGHYNFIYNKVEGVTYSQFGG